MAKITSVRLDDDLAEDLDQIARIRGHSISEEIRNALYKYVEHERSSPGLRSEVERLGAFVSAGNTTRRR